MVSQGFSFGSGVKANSDFERDKGALIPDLKKAIVGLLIRPVRRKTL
jgi:hypothetical protein